ncbi:MAG TPA: phosphomannomutase, partial [bacterium]|nr:phosphomannomutase [bacterium]
VCLRGVFKPAPAPGRTREVDIMADYIQRLLTYVDIHQLKPFKVVVNAGNGCAGPVVDRLEPYLPFQLVKIHHEPDASFPHGIPNPLLVENRQPTIDAVIQNQADIGIAWDGDFDRCFFFDEKGNFIEGYYIVGFLAQALLAKQPGSAIIYDPRLTWNTIEVVKNHGGRPVQCKSGHAFIKEKMRHEEAIYGGEMSAHHYFKDFFYCDSGMIPWLLVLEILSREGKPFSTLVEERIRKFPCSGEINNRVADADAAIEQVRRHFEPLHPRVDTTDGISFEFPDWRFNLRKSNTEPVLRLNVETRGSIALMEEKTREILNLIQGNA